MNRAVATALSLLCLLMATDLGSPELARAQVAEPPEEKQRRLDLFQERRLIFEPGAQKGDEPAKNGSPAPFNYTLRQGPETIYDKDFVELMNDPSLTQFWLGERNRDYAYWLGAGAVGVPVGAMIFYQNFIGEGPLAPFKEPSVGDKTLPGDWRTFSLTVAGAALAGYGLYTLSLWLLEELDLRHPNRLDQDSITPRVNDWNERLRERLNLDPQDIPSPPTPRPSPTPTPSPSEDWDGEGADLNLPSPPVGGPDDQPYGGPPPAMPLPLPVETPGAIPSRSPAPSPRPSVFRFPGEPTPGVSPPPPSGTSP